MSATIKKLTISSVDRDTRKMKVIRHVLVTDEFVGVNKETGYHSLPDFRDLAANLEPWIPIIHISVIDI